MVIPAPIASCLHHSGRQRPTGVLQQTVQEDRTKICGILSGKASRHIIAISDGSIGACPGRLPHVRSPERGFVRAAPACDDPLHSAISANATSENSATSSRYPLGRAPTSIRLNPGTPRPIHSGEIEESTRKWNIQPAWRRSLAKDCQWRQITLRISKVVGHCECRGRCWQRPDCRGFSHQDRVPKRSHRRHDLP